MEFIFKGKRIRCVGLFGYGRSNRAVMNYLRGRYPSLSFVLREDGTTALEKNEINAFRDIRRGRAAREGFYEDLLVLSPAIRPDRADIIEARLGGAEITSDAELFFMGFNGKTFAISGSDGKSTTTTLCSLLLSRGSRRVPAIGNIGVAMTPWLERDIDLAAVELSSFQLFSADISADRALITNAAPNHLDWHTSIEEYLYAKEKLIRLAKDRVINLDCDFSSSLLDKYGAGTTYSVKLTAKEQKRIFEGNIISLEDGWICVNEVKILHTGAVKCNSRHNIQNLLGAIAITLGHTDEKRIREVASEFSGLPHRCELVGCFDGVRYVNSSIDSTPKRTLTTLSGFKKGITVILGGRSKGLDYAPLADALCERGDRAVLTGETGLVLADMLAERGYSACEYFADFDDAVRCAAASTQEDGVVLLSPASTSFDRFTSYEERGNRFKDLIRNIHYRS